MQVDGGQVQVIHPTPLGELAIVTHGPSLLRADTRRLV